MRMYDIADRPDITFPFAIEKGVCNGAFPEHQHKFTELSVVLDGTALNTVEGVTQRIGRGDVFVIAQPLIHRMDEQRDLYLYTVKFDLDKLILSDYDLKWNPGFRALFIECPPGLKASAYGRLVLTEEQLAFVAATLEFLYQEFMTRQPGYKMMIRTHLLALTAYLSRCFLPLGETGSAQLCKILPSVRYMEENLQKNIRVGELAELVYLSERQYSRVFKAVYGMSPAAYMIELRLHAACRMMENQALSLSAIAQACGFSDSAFFSRQFKSRFGVTPNQYRSKLQ